MVTPRQRHRTLRDFRAVIIREGGMCYGVLDGINYANVIFWPILDWWGKLTWWSIVCVPTLCKWTAFELNHSRGGNWAENVSIFFALRQLLRKIRDSREALFSMRNIKLTTLLGWVKVSRYLLGDEESVLWYSELLLSVTMFDWWLGCKVVFFDRLLVDWHLWSRFDEPNNRRLWRRSKLRGVGNEALRLFAERGYKILSFGFPPQITSARFVWMHWCVKSPSRSVEISP